MNCAELDDLIDRSLAPSDWPAKAREHLAACPRCRAMEEALARISSADQPRSLYSAYSVSFWISRSD